MDWEKTVHECIEERVNNLKSQCINKRKKHTLKTRRHKYYLDKLQEKYVIVPADKAANIDIVIWKKKIL